MAAKKADLAIVFGGGKGKGMGGPMGDDMPMEEMDDMGEEDEFSALATELGLDPEKMRLLFDAYMLEREA